jgi:hypothetical protein
VFVAGGTDGLLQVFISIAVQGSRGPELDF